MKKTISPAVLALISLFVLASCKDRVEVKAMAETKPEKNFGGYASMEKWGQHLVTIAGCHDCHSPKVMTPQGMEFDSSRLLSGHPAELPEPMVSREQMESKGYI